MKYCHRNNWRLVMDCRFNFLFLMPSIDGAKHITNVSLHSLSYSNFATLANRKRYKWTPRGSMYCVRGLWLTMCIIYISRELPVLLISVGKA